MAEVIPIEDERLKRILSYPQFTSKHYEKVLGELKEIGVRGVLSEGRVEIDNFRVLGKGCVGIVLLGFLDSGETALKILRSDADRVSLAREGELLKYVNRAGIGPDIVAVKDNVIAMEYIRGEVISRWLKVQKERDKVRSVVKELLRQCWTLDEIGVDHGELSDAKKHVIVTGQGVPRIIDFESASRDRKCRNLVAISGYLFFKKGIAEYLKTHISWDDYRLKELLREYKALRSKEAYEKILLEVGL